MQYIFLHGLGQTAESWEQMLQTIHKKEPLACPSLSDWLHGELASYDILYQNFENYCDSITGPVGLCGLSLGGVLALQYGIEHPEKVHSLTLIGTQYRMPKRLLKAQNLIFRLMPDKAFSGMGLGKQGFIRLSHSMLELDFQNRLGQLACPVLIICGEKDRANKPASFQLKEQIHGAELVVLPHSGHEANLDAPENLALILSAFFRRHDPGF